MSEQVTAYPLSWPVGHPRTQSYAREEARFNYKGAQGYKKNLTVPMAMSRLQEEVERLRPEPKQVVLSTNVALRLDGNPRGGLSEPDDPGACLYFVLGTVPHAMPCDKWSRVADNIAAIAKHIEAIRGQERWGVASVEQMFTGFAQLPPRSAEAAIIPETPWFEVLGVLPNAPLEVCESVYRTLAKSLHPDSGGSDALMARLNRAIETAREQKES